MNKQPPAVEWNCICFTLGGFLCLAEIASTDQIVSTENKTDTA